MLDDLPTRSRHSPVRLVHWLCNAVSSVILLSEVSCSEMMERVDVLPLETDSLGAGAWPTAHFKCINRQWLVRDFVALFSWRSRLCAGLQAGFFWCKTNSELERFLKYVALVPSRKCCRLVSDTPPYTYKHIVTNYSWPSRIRIVLLGNNYPRQAGCVYPSVYPLTAFGP